MITWTIWFTCPQHGNNGSRLHKEDPVGNSSEFEARVLRHSAALMLLYYSPILSKIFILLFEKKLISIIKILALSLNNSIEIRKIIRVRIATITTTIIIIIILSIIDGGKKWSMTLGARRKWKMTSHIRLYLGGEKNETFSLTGEKTRAHRSFLNPEAREPTEISSRDSLGRFLPDVEKFQTARNVRNDVNSFLTYRKRTHRRNEDESNRPCLSHGLEKERVESRRKGGSFTEHKIHAFHVSSRGSFRASFSCRVWTGEEFRSVSSDSFLSFPTLLPP